MLKTMKPSLYIEKRKRGIPKCCILAWIILMKSMTSSKGFGMASLACAGNRAIVLKEVMAPRPQLGMTKNSDEKDDETIGDGELSVIEDLNWRVEKLRLEEQNTKRFLKAGPRFLPYEECRKWVKAWSRWNTEEEWKAWISMGEKRNPYVPARPDEYYGRLGKWISWEHFLGIDET